jgi:hypothetical protein
MSLQTRTVRSERLEFIERSKRTGSLIERYRGSLRLGCDALLSLGSKKHCSNCVRYAVMTRGREFKFALFTNCVPALGIGTLEDALLIYQVESLCCSNDNVVLSKCLPGLRVW